MFIRYEGRTILCVSDTRPDGSFLEIPDLDPSDVLTNYEVVDGAFVHKQTFTDPKTLKVAMVTSYGINCGLATYAKYLCDKMRPMVKELRIFAEEAKEADLSNDGPDLVTRCWDREGLSYSKLINAIHDYEPDVIYIQHEYGCFANGAKWNTLVGHLANYRTVIMLHSVYDHPDKLIFESPCAEIIVHSASGRELLKKRGITHCPIHHIPHGCSQPKTVDVKFARMNCKHVIFQYGFGFEYKGWDQVIDIVTELKKSYTDVTYIGVFNISQFSKDFSETYYKRLMETIRARGLQDNMVLVKGFRSEEVLLSYMAQASVNIFPYWNHPEWKVFGASGAIRLALGSGTPTIVGAVPFFDEMKGYIPVCASVDEYVTEISKLFSDGDYRDMVIGQTRKFIEERTWDKIAAWYLECLTSKEFSAL